MFNKDHEQKAEAGSVAIQAGGSITIQQGISYTEAKDICIELLRPVLVQLTNMAREVAQLRGEKIIEAFLLQLMKEYPAGLNKAQDPAFQFDLVTVQKEYARTGDEDLGALLVDLLVDRCKQEQRDILQIVLTESLNTASKLTEHQLAVLAIAFLFKYTEYNGAMNHILLGEYFDTYVASFATKIVKTKATYQHLQYTGCGSIEMGQISLESILGRTYQGLFLKGFESKEISDRGISIGTDNRFFIPCLNDPLKLQVNALNKGVLEEKFQKYAISDSDRAHISALFDSGKMNDAEVRNKCIEIRSYMSGVFECWSESAMKNFTLTSVGIAIGHANIKRLIGKEFADLSIWIN